MKRVLTLVVTTLLALALTGARQVSKSVSVVPKDGPLQGQTVYTDSWAVFVGIGTYKNGQIPTIPPAPNDARTMRDLLVSKYGFNPSHAIVLTDADATKENIDRALSRLADTNLVKPTDRVFVFFSCHGQGLTLQDGGGAGYLIPYDATINLGDVSNPSAYQASCLNMEEIVTNLKACPAKHRTVAVDACFSGFAVGSKALTGTTFSADALKRMLDLSGLYVMTAGTEGQEATAEGSKTGLSTFTRALVDSLNEGTINGGTFTVGQLAAEAYAKTSAASDGKQTPLYGQKAGSGQMLLFSATAGPPVVAGGVKQLATEASLSVTATPSDATIEVDGRVVAAQSTVEVDPGVKKTVIVKVSKPGYKTAAFQVDLTAGQTSPLSVTLEALAGGVASTTGLGMGSTKKSDKGEIDMVYVPAGEFTMGSDAGDQAAVRKVTLDAYWIGKNDVTVGEFKAYCADRGIDFSTFPVPSWGWKNDNPMVNVSYDDAESFCKWAGGDLPTEAQWEKAARGEDGRVYPWGNDWDPSKLWWNQPLQGGSTAPVGSFPGGKSPYGCLDMAGNVWQWCLDWYGPYDATVTKNPTGAGFATNRVLRGGSWYNNNPDHFRCAYRAVNVPSNRDNAVGFRLAGRP